MVAGARGEDWASGLSLKTFRLRWVNTSPSLNVFHTEREACPGFNLSELVAVPSSSKIPRFIHFVLK